jgi:hypothetical protein
MQAQSGAGEAMYGFVGCTVRWFMTGTVAPVNRQTTMRDLRCYSEAGRERRSFQRKTAPIERR